MGDILPPQFWQKDCVANEEDTHRMWLARDADAFGAREMIVFMLANPSVAGLEQRDHTDRKVNGFSVRNGFRRYGIINPFTRRATDPNDLMANGYEDAVGPLADKAIEAVLAQCTQEGWPCVVGWGSLGDAPHFRRRLADLYDLLSGQLGVEWLCLGRTAKGQPKHPLMLAYSTPLEPWDWSTSALSKYKGGGR